MRNIEESYNVVADEYAQRIFDELDGKPFDRELLDRFAVRFSDSGTVADIGCGPGHIAKYLHARGVKVCGYDLSPQMLKNAETLNPEIEFFQGNMAALDAPDNRFAGIIAFYSIIHIPREQVVETLTEFKRVLQADGVLLLSFHIGDEVVHLDEWWDRQVSLDFTFFQSDEMTGYLEAAGFRVDDVIEREPYAPEIEHQSRRSYVNATASGGKEDSVAE